MRESQAADAVAVTHRREARAKALILGLCVRLLNVRLLGESIVDRLAEHLGKRSTHPNATNDRARVNVRSRLHGRLGELECDGQTEWPDAHPHPICIDIGVVGHSVSFASLTNSPTMTYSTSPAISSVAIWVPRLAARRRSVPARKGPGCRVPTTHELPPLIVRVSCSTTGGNSCVMGAAARPSGAFARGRPQRLTAGDLGPAVRVCRQPAWRPHRSPTGGTRAGRRLGVAAHHESMRLDGGDSRVIQRPRQRSPDGARRRPTLHRSRR